MEEKDRRFYDENGYVVIKQVVKDEELDPVREENKRVVDRKINELYKQGLISK